jgi:hypothetical protein
MYLGYGGGVQQSAHVFVGIFSSGGRRAALKTDATAIICEMRRLQSLEGIKKIILGQRRKTAAKIHECRLRNMNFKDPI